MEIENCIHCKKKQGKAATEEMAVESARACQGLQLNNRDFPGDSDSMYYLQALWLGVSLAHKSQWGQRISPPNTRHTPTPHTISNAPASLSRRLTHTTLGERQFREAPFADEETKARKAGSWI